MSHVTVVYVPDKIRQLGTVLYLQRFGEMQLGQYLSYLLNTCRFRHDATEYFPFASYRSIEGC